MSHTVRAHLVVLICDDNYQPARHVVYEVECCGGEAHQATTAAETLDAAAELQPDVIVLDGILACGSPDYGVCRALRASGYNGLVLFHGGLIKVKSRTIAVGAGIGYRATRGLIDDAAKGQIPRSLREWLAEIARGRA